jgi:sensor histidine kinase YesM
VITFTSSTFYSRFGKINNIINAIWVLCAIIMIIIGIKRGYKGALLNIISMICILAAYFHDVIYWDNKILDSFGETIYIGLFLAILVQMLTQAGRIQEFHDKKTAAELSFLQAQIKPHFLYNTLNTFISISRYDPEKARNLLYDFSNYLRKSFDFKDLSQFVPLKDEIELAKAYTEIEKARHEEDVIVNFDVDEEINVNVPRLVLQPIIENAIKHGILPKGECGTVDISIKKINNKIVFEIKDNGVGIKEEKLKQIFKRDEKSRVGILNIERRLKKLYGKGLQINSKEGIGTEITWEIPII